MKDDILVVSGLTLNPARSLGDGAGDHARAMASFLTGRHPRKTDGADLCAGISIDQLAADRIGAATRFPSLELGCEGGRNAGECDHGYSCAYQSNLSWRGESTPVAKQINPRLVFDRLFGAPASGSDPDRDARRTTGASSTSSPTTPGGSAGASAPPIVASWTNTSGESARSSAGSSRRSRAPTSET